MSDLVGDYAGMHMFAAKVLELCRDGGFDGINIAWEFPDDKDTLIELLKVGMKLRTPMNQYETWYTNERILCV